MSENIWRVSSTWLRSQNLIFKKSGFRRCIIYTHRELTFSAYGSPCFVGGELWSDYHCKTHKNSTIPKHIQFCLLSFILKVVAKKPDQCTIFCHHPIRPPLPRQHQRKPIRLSWKGSSGTLWFLNLCLKCVSLIKLKYFKGSKVVIICLQHKPVFDHGCSLA